VAAPFSLNCFAGFGYPDTFMSVNSPTCPMCDTSEVLTFPEKWECLTCGHEWERERAAEPDAPTVPRVVKDAHGNVLADGDCVILIKDLKLGGSQVLKGGSKSKPIRLVDSDHEISCKVDNIAVGLKACFVKKA
jgi:protein PhnA